MRSRGRSCERLVSSAENESCSNAAAFERIRRSAPDSRQPRDFADDEPVASGALVEVEHEGKRTTYPTVPAGGGVTLSDGGKPVLTLTPQSPLGALLMRTSVGDEVSMAGPRGPRVFEIVAVR